MIQPINSINPQIYIHKNINFRNTSSAVAEVPAKGAVSVDTSSALLKYMEEKDKQEKIDKRNGYIFAGLTTAALIGSMFFIPKIMKKGLTRSVTLDGDMLFESLKNNNKIPTLDTCNSIDKGLKTFLENQVIYAKATKEDLVKTGAPEAANRLIMYGKPGSGKSFFAKIFAKTLDADYMEVKYSDINKRYCGEQIEHMKNLFEGIIDTGKKYPNKRFVLNFNEIDALAPPIEHLQGSSYNVFKKEERNVFLTFIEEVAEKAPNITIIGSSNAKPGKGIDGAVASRFQNIIEVQYPDKECIFEALKEQISKLPEGKSFVENNKEKLEQFAQKMNERSASFRNLNNIINESKNIYLKNVLKDKNSTYKYEYLEEALKGLGSTDGEITKTKGRSTI